MSPDAKPWTPSNAGVYFVRWGGHIKIGSTGDIAVRLRVLICSIPEGDVEPLGWIDVAKYSTYRRLEKHIHHVLRRFRGRGEWFTDCPEIRRFIARYAKPWPEAK